MPLTKTPRAALTKRRKWIGIAVATLLAVVGIAYLLGFPPFAPTPWQARAALAESGWCKPDAPITRHDEKLFIGRIECDLPNRTCQVSRGMEWRVRFTHSWDISFTTPFGRWVASSPVVM